MPTGVVENEDDGSIDASTGLSRKGFEQRRKERLRHAVMHIPKGFAARRRDEGGHVEPIETMMTRRDRLFADARPDAARHRLQPEPVFVAGEDLDRSFRMLFRFFGDGVFEAFLKIAVSSSVADLGFFGRGVWHRHAAGFQRLPAALNGDAGQSQFARDERRDLGARPQTAVARVFPPLIELWGIPESASI